MPAGIPARTARHILVRHILVVLVVGGALAACDDSPGPTPPTPARPTAATASPEPAELVALRARPLRLPTLMPGDACPVTAPAPPEPPPPAGHPLNTGMPASALGRAPLFPDARYFGTGVRLLVYPQSTDPGWYSSKTPWASRTGYLGWALIRTARLDGPGRARVQLQLADGTKTSDALAVNVQADWQFWPGGTQVTGAGCYAYQVDGSGFTEVIVFRTELGSGPAAWHASIYLPIVEMRSVTRTTAWPESSRRWRIRPAGDCWTACGPTTARP